MDWKPLKLTDKSVVDDALRGNPLLLSDYSFTNLWIWNSSRDYQIALIDNFLCIKFLDQGLPTFLYPIGTGSRGALIEKLSKEHTPFRMRAIPAEALEELQELSFTISPEANRFDYIYSFEDLLHLHGDHYQSKRNFIHQFERNYQFEYREITPNIIPLVIEAENRWCREHLEKSTEMANEHQAVLRAFNDFTSLQVYGGALMIEQQVIAYSLAEQISEEMIIIHLEKALNGYSGAYPMINQQMLKHLPPTIYVNREEDLGFLNLRKAKESYHPLRLGKKYLLTA